MVQPNNKNNQIMIGAERASVSSTLPADRVLLLLSPARLLIGITPLSRNQRSCFCGRLVDSFPAIHVFHRGDKRHAQCGEEVNDPQSQKHRAYAKLLR